MSDGDYITFEEAVKILRDELKYPEDRALYFVKKFDKNNDGKLSASEFNLFKKNIEETKTKIIPKFKEYDRDNNGFVTLEEANQILQSPPFNFPAGRVVVLLRKFDKDGNGKLDIDEFADFYAEAKSTKELNESMLSQESIAARFDELDKDGNGVLTPDEVAGILKEMFGFDQETANCMVEMFDTNQDGSLDKKEFMQMWTSMFA